MNTRHYKKTSRAMRITALILAGLIAMSMTVPLWVGK